MSYNLVQSDCMIVPNEVDTPIMLIWTNPPAKDWKYIADRVIQWYQVMAKFGTVIIARTEFDSEEHLREAATDDILAHTSPGDLVVDPFCGGSNTGVAALRLGRLYLGVDISAEAIALSRRNLRAHNL